MKKSEVLFENIDGGQQITEIESLCMGCHENGVTRMLLTKIPFFREVVIMSFECPHCGLKNNEIQPAAAIQEFGCKQVCTVNDSKDLSRQVVKSEYATVRFEELDFEIPSSTQKGVLTTIDGIIDRAIEGLGQDQPVRKHMQPEAYEQIEKVLAILQDYLQGTKPFTLSIDDPTGNSFIENFAAPNPDPKLKITTYKRTKEVEQEMGFSTSNLEQQDEPEDEFALNEQVHSFPGNCSRCSAPSETKMHLLDIPHFKEVVIMSTVCDACGYKSNEVKAGGAISPKGQRITLKVVEAEDLNRDILKSETCGMKIPEVDLELTTGTLGGRFTTIEGLLSQVKEELETRAFSGDSTSEKDREKFRAFLEKLNKLLTLEICPFTVVLDDPLANSHLQNLYAPDPDPNMTIEEYERTYEQNEAFGLNDIVTEGYDAE